MINPVSGRRRILGAVGALVIGCGALAACSSSGGSNPGASTSGGSNASSSGGDIVIGNMAPVATSSVDFGGIPAAVEAAANQINQNGGINGRKIKVVTCNTQYVANQELACARQLVAAHAVAAIGMNNALQGTALEKILSDAHIADIENVGPLPASFQGTNTFPLTWELGSFSPCASSAIKNATGGKSVVFVGGQMPALPVVEPIIQKSAEAAGLAWKAPITHPLTVTDYSPYVAKAMASGADIVALLELGSGPQAFVRASSSAGAKYAICTALGLSGSGGWANLGSATNNLYVGATFKPLSESNSLPLMKSLIDSFAAEKSSGSQYAKYASTAPADFQAQAMGAWLGVQAFAQVAKTIKGDITAQSVLNALPTAKVNLGGIIPNIDFSQKQSAGDYKRVFNSDAYLWKWDSSTNSYQLAGSDPDTLKVLGG